MGTCLCQETQAVFRATPPKRVSQPRGPKRGSFEPMSARRWALKAFGCGRWPSSLAMMSEPISGVASRSGRARPPGLPAPPSHSAKRGPSISASLERPLSGGFSSSPGSLCDSNPPGTGCRQCVAMPYFVWCCLHTHHLTTPSDQSRKRTLVARSLSLRSGVSLPCSVVPLGLLPRDHDLSERWAWLQDHHAWSPTHSQVISRDCID